MPVKGTVEVDVTKAVETHIQAAIANALSGDPSKLVEAVVRKQYSASAARRTSNGTRVVLALFTRFNVDCPLRRFKKEAILTMFFFSMPDGDPQRASSAR